MGFELYKKTRALSKDETITISKAGTITISPALTEDHLKNTEFVQLYYDAQTKRVAIKPIKKDEHYGFQIIRPASSKRAVISGRGFLRTYKINESGKVFRIGTYDAKWENEMIVFSVK
jgi:hypothetical protein